ncbi:hypothetical protein Dsin_024213 [Dipteronia sinensis]|uniref:Uncharacterized protein n=1 Tax=Dipteronia sinensis TaxID=43782 RepID=A0AAE0DW00_9ROSI|nr:hypothetical protein Dsin_024213 [Dipteronia sinensis]
MKEWDSCSRGGSKETGGWTSKAGREHTLPFRHVFDRHYMSLFLLKQQGLSQLAQIYLKLSTDEDQPPSVALEEETGFPLAVEEVTNSLLPFSQRTTSPAMVSIAATEQLPQVLSIAGAQQLFWRRWWPVLLQRASSIIVIDHDRSGDFDCDGFAVVTETSLL